MAILINDYLAQRPMRSLLILLAVVAAIVIIKRLIATPARCKTDKPAENTEFQTTIQCAHCGTHVPLTLAYKSDDRYFCNKQHFLAFKK